MALVSYKQLMIPTPDPSGDGGAALSNDLKALADCIGPVNYSATTDPLITDDVDAGYYQGSRWQNVSTSQEFICFSNSSGAAVWKQTTGALQLSTPIAGVYGGTGVSNNEKTITLGGNLTLSGANNLTLTTTGATTITLPTSGTLLSNAVAITVGQGGTGQTTALAGFNALSPLTTAGDLLYGGASGSGTRLAIGTATQILHGGASNPSWSALSLTADVSGTLPIANGGTAATTASAARTALGLAIGSNVQAYSSVLDAVAASTFAGSTAITTLGTIATGVWNGTTIAIANGGTGQTTATTATNALLPSQSGNTGKFLTSDGTNTSWGAAGNPFNQTLNTSSSPTFSTMTLGTGSGPSTSSLLALPALIYGGSGGVLGQPTKWLNINGSQVPAY